MQRNAAFRDPTLAAAYMVGAQAPRCRLRQKHRSGRSCDGVYGHEHGSERRWRKCADLYQMGQQAQSSPLRQAMLWVLRQTFLPQDGPARAVRRKTAADSARAGGAPQPQPGVMAGFAAAVRRTKGSSAPNAVSPSQSRAMAGRARAERLTKEVLQRVRLSQAGGVPQYRCDKCGWEPQPGAQLAKFCRVRAIRSTTGTSCASPLTILPAADLR